MILMNKHQNKCKTVRQKYDIDASPNRREARQNADIGGSNSKEASVSRLHRTTAGSQAR